MNIGVSFPFSLNLNIFFHRATFKNTLYPILNSLSIKTQLTTFKKRYKYMERKKRWFFLSLKAGSNPSCNNPPLVKKLPSKPPLHITPPEHLCENRVEEWKENWKHEERERVEGRLEQQKKERKTEREKRKNHKNFLQILS